jgi:hypothetical protein
MRMEENFVGVSSHTKDTTLQFSPLFLCLKILSLWDSCLMSPTTAQVPHQVSVTLIYQITYLSQYNSPNLKLKVIPKHLIIYYLPYKSTITIKINQESSELCVIMCVLNVTCRGTQGVSKRLDKEYTMCPGGLR